MRVSQTVTVRVKLHPDFLAVYSIVDTLVWLGVPSKYLQWMLRPFFKAEIVSG